jgi:hypothetical protein
MTLKMVITNHFDESSEFRIELEPDDAFPFQITPSELVRELTVEPGAEQSMEWVLTPKNGNVISEGVKIGFLSARVTSGDSLTGRSEAVIKVSTE